jgi:H+/Cl- antiporter ClcA
MGMSGALAAFFGAPLGGSLFAMEVNSRFGIEYFEHTLEAVFAGEVCLVVFRGLANLPIEPIWAITTPKLGAAVPLDIVYGAVIGLIGALTAYFFAQFHQRVMGAFGTLGLMPNERAVSRALLGSVPIVVLGMLIPHTMFWGEFEIDTLGTMSPASTLDHIWPTYGLIGFEMNSASTAFVVGVTKLIAISFTVAGGYRGGYIFPAMASGVAFGHTIHYLFPFVPLQLCCLCMAGAINVAITRTAIATTLILAYLAGEQNGISAILASCLVSLFATGYMPFIKTQMARADLDTSLYYDDDETVHVDPNDENNNGHV